MAIIEVMSVIRKRPPFRVSRNPAFIIIIISFNVIKQINYFSYLNDYDSISLQRKFYSHSFIFGDLIS